MGREEAATKPAAATPLLKKPLLEIFSGITVTSEELPKPNIRIHPGPPLALVDKKGGQVLGFRSN
jgi:hypothetical protein